MVFRCILLMHAISSSSPSLGVESMTDGHNNYTGCGYNDVFDEPAMGNGTYPSLFCPMYAIFLFNTTCLHTLSFRTHQTRPSHPLSSISCMHPISIKSIVSCPCLILSHMHGSLHYPSNHPSNPFSHSKTFSYPLSFSHHLS